MTYGDLHARILRTAGWLRARGVGRGDVVAVRLPKSLGFLQLHLGAMALGAAILPLHPAATASEAAYLCEDAGAVLQIFDDLPDLEGEPVEPVQVEPDEVAILLYTSGTTGRPKGAPISHRNLLANVRALHEAWHWSERDVLLHALPLFHVHGLFVAQWGAMYAGATAIWLGRFDVDAVLEHLPKATVFMGVPTFYARLLAAGPRAALPGMRLFTSGSAPLPAAHHAAFERTFGHRILERYGMTEVGIVLSNPYEGERKPGAVGMPLPGMLADVVDDEGNPCSVGELGQIRIGGPSVFAGYLGRPEATAAALIDGWMHTGDLGFVDADGYFHVVGRAGDMILSGGFNVYPREVEAALEALVDGIEVAVFGVPDPDLGERVAAAYTGAFLEDAVLAGLRMHLAPYKLPRRWFRVDELPRNSMGKVQKAVLRQRFGVTVRPATLEDLEHLVEGNHRMALESEDLELDRDVLRAGVRGALEGNAACYIAERDGVYAGQAMVTREWSDWRNGWNWWLQSIWVPEDHRRHGVLHALHDAITASARASGAIGLRLYVHTSNERARTAYERLGMHDESYRVMGSSLRGTSG